MTGFSEEEFIAANPGRDRNDIDKKLICWVCGAECVGRILCTQHMQHWTQYAENTKSMTRNVISDWVMAHKDFNGKRPYDQYLLANSEWIADVTLDTIEADDPSL